VQVEARSRTCSTSNGWAPWEAGGGGGPHLRNLMVSLGYVESVLEQRSVAPDVMESVQVGMQGVGNLIHTLEAMHQFARADPDHPEGDAAASLVVNDALAISRMDMSFRAHKVAVSIEEGLLPFRRPPEAHASMVIWCATRCRRPRNGARSGSKPRARTAMSSFAVEDEGPGVSAAVRRTCSSPSSQARRGGMGMGLYMAKLIIDSHQGEIAVLDRPSGGARFEVRLQPAEDPS